MQDVGSALINNEFTFSDGAAAQAYAGGYASTIKRFDLLEREDEQQLARRWHAHKDRRAIDALVTSHLRLAAKIARQYQGYRLPLADLIAEANLGLSSRPRVSSRTVAHGFRPMPCGGSRPRSTITSCDRGHWSRSARHPRSGSCSLASGAR